MFSLKSCLSSSRSSQTQHLKQTHLLAGVTGRWRPFVSQEEDSCRSQRAARVIRCEGERVERPQRRLQQQQLTYFSSQANNFGNITCDDGNSPSTCVSACWYAVTSATPLTALFFRLRNSLSFLFLTERQRSTLAPQSMLLLLENSPPEKKKKINEMH